MTKKQLLELISKAKSATPGPWQASDINTNHKEVCAPHADGNYWITSDTSDQKDCEYIASANPQTVIDLCERLLKMQEALEKMIRKPPSMDGMDSWPWEARLANKTLEKFGLKEKRDDTRKNN